MAGNREEGHEMSQPGAHRHGAGGEEARTGRQGRATCSKQPGRREQLQFAQVGASKPTEVAFVTPSCLEGPLTVLSALLGWRGACPLRPRAPWGEMSPPSQCGSYWGQNSFLSPWLATGSLIASFCMCHIFLFSKLPSFHKY